MDRLREDPAFPVVGWCSDFTAVHSRDTFALLPAAYFKQSNTPGTRLVGLPATAPPNMRQKNVIPQLHIRDFCCQAHNLAAVCFCFVKTVFKVAEKGKTGFQWEVKFITKMPN